MQQRLSICSLFYGDHPKLAQRCLTSISESLQSGNSYVQDFRLACNAVTEDTRQIVRDFALRAWEDHRIPSRIFYAGNVFKYPIMRRMFYAHEPLAPVTMWFDDDSYFDPIPPTKWWREIWVQLEEADMLGQLWLMPIQGNQWEWIQSQPWYNPDVGKPHKKYRGGPCFEFCQGAWWVIRSKILKQHDWPLAEIRHNGGDSMLGELLRHQGFRLGRFYGNVRINADDQGRFSKSKRRGMSEKRVGWNYSGKPLDTSHQVFAYDTELVGDTGETAGSPQNSGNIINLFGTDTDGY